MEKEALNKIKGLGVISFLSSIFCSFKTFSRLQFSNLSSSRMIRLNRQLTSTVCRLGRPRVGVTSDNLIIGKRRLLKLYICLFIVELRRFSLWSPASAKCCRHLVRISASQAKASSTKSDQRRD